MLPWSPFLAELTRPLTAGTSRQAQPVQRSTVTLLMKEKWALSWVQRALLLATWGQYLGLSLHGLFAKWGTPAALSWGLDSAER